MFLLNNISSMSSKSGLLLSCVGVNKLLGGLKGFVFFLLFNFFIGNKMGNGVSVFSINVDGENIDIIKLKILVFEFKKEFKIRDVKL